MNEPTETSPGDAVGPNPAPPGHAPGESRPEPPSPTPPSAPKRRAFVRPVFEWFVRARDIRDAKARARALEPTQRELFVRARRRLPRDTQNVRA
jgi:hypothetical protein